MTKNNLGKSKWDKIIIGAGLYILWREQVRGVQPQAPPPLP